MLFRQPLLGAAITASLERAGAGDVALAVTRATPWSVELENVGFNLRTQRVDARRVTLARDRWWQPSLGELQIEGLVLPVRVDGSGTNPWNWATYAGTGEFDAGGGMPLPVEEISVEGQIVVQVAALPDRPVEVKFHARESGDEQWEGEIEARAPGFSAKSTATYSLASGDVAFRIERSEIDLTVWHRIIERLITVPGGGGWDVAGKLSGAAEGAWSGVDRKLVAKGDISLREGSVRYPEHDLTAAGVEADFTFTDFDAMQSEPGLVRIASLTSGKLSLTNVEARFAFKGPESLAVDAVQFEAFGGTVSADPFKLFLNLREIDATVTVERLDIAQLLALTEKVPAKARGRVDGKLPIHFDGSGIRFGTGWLALTQGVPAELELQAEGLLTGGTDRRSPSYAVLKKVESGLLRLRLNQLRLEVRPPNAPPGRSAVLHLKGEPVDPEVKAPVTLDLNINGPIERLINLGLDDRVSVGTGR